LVSKLGILCTLSFTATAIIPAAKAANNCFAARYRPFHDTSIPIISVPAAKPDAPFPANQSGALIHHSVNVSRPSFSFYLRSKRSIGDGLIDESSPSEITVIGVPRFRHDAKIVLTNSQIQIASFAILLNL